MRNFGGSPGPTMPQLWEQTLANDASTKWNFSSWVPDTVVVHLGANDLSQPPAPPFEEFEKVRSSDKLPSSVWSLCCRCACCRPFWARLMMNENVFADVSLCASQAFNALLDRIIAVYVPPVNAPSLLIVVTCGPFKIYCRDHYQRRVILRRDDGNVSFVPMEGSLPDESNPGPYTGCGDHPNALGDSYMADAIAATVFRSRKLR